MILAVSAATFPGAAAPVAAVALPAYEVVAGTVLHASPPAHALPVKGYHLTGRFGDHSGLWSSVHTGLDFAAPSGTPIRSVARGVVTAVGYDGAYGTRTVVRLAGGTDLWYCHQSSTRVAVGDRVRVGQLIGTVGSTGNATGSHLHLEVRPRTDVPVDPLAWLRARGLHP